MNRSESSTTSQRTFSFRRAFAAWREFSFMRPKPRSRQTRLRFERLEDRTVLASPYSPTIFADGGLGSGSLRDAILQANADPDQSDVYILIPPGTYTLSIGNNGQENDGFKGDLDITSRRHNTIIMGGGSIPGSQDPDPTMTVINANNIDRAFQIFFTHTNVTFKNLTIKGGLAQDDGIDGRLPGTSDALGGAILSNDSTVILDQVIIRNNKAVGGNGANGASDVPGGDGFNANGGGVYLEGGELTLTESQIHDNQANAGTGGKGGTLVLQDLAAAPGGHGGAAQGGGLHAFHADVTLTTSIISSNLASGGWGGKGGYADNFGIGGDGGLGGDSDGGGVYATGDTVTLISSTISDNIAGGGRGGEGGMGNNGGNGGQAGNAFGGGLMATGSDALTLTDTDLLGNVAQGGDGGAGRSASSVNPDLGLFGDGGNGGHGGAGWGGGLYAVNEYGPRLIADGQVKDNEANGGRGGKGGNGANTLSKDAGGFGGAGGTGGVAQGGGLFVGAEFQFTITTTEVSENFARAGHGGDGGKGGNGEDFGGLGAEGGAGGDALGGGLFFSLAPNTPVNVTDSPILSNHALGGGGGRGGSGGNGPDEKGGPGGLGGAGGTAQGGGIFLGHNLDVGGNLTLTSLPLSSNEAIGGDGGRGKGGGLGESGGSGGLALAGGAGQGGGLFADGSSVTIETSTISSNKAQGGSGDNGGRAGKATDEDGAAGGGGGTGGAGQGGGLFASNATIDISQSTIDHNKAIGAKGGKGGQGGKASDDAGGDGGHGGTGGAGQGGGLHSFDSTIALTNSTVSTNTALGGTGGDGGRGGNGDDNDNGGAGGFGGDGGAIQGGGIYVSGGTLTLVSNTITANMVRPSAGGEGAKGGTGGFLGLDGSGQPGAGGGVFNLNIMVDSFNTLIAENTAKIAPDFSGLFDMAMNNLLGNNDGANLAAAFPDAKGNLVGSTVTSLIDPKLGPLANNGGPTKTHALLVNSPAINKGDNNSLPGSTDQRGAGFPRIVGSIIDIGAFEFKARAGTK